MHLGCIYRVPQPSVHSGFFGDSLLSHSFADLEKELTVSTLRRWYSAHPREPVPHPRSARRLQPLHEVEEAARRLLLMLQYRVQEDVTPHPQEFLARCLAHSAPPSPCTVNGEERGGHNGVG